MKRWEGSDDDAGGEEGAGVATAGPDPAALCCGASVRPVAVGTVVVALLFGPKGRASRGLVDEGGVVVLGPLKPDWLALFPAADGGLELPVGPGTNA